MRGKEFHNYIWLQNKLNLVGYKCHLNKHFNRILLFLLENTFERKRISANLSPNSNPNSKAQ